MWNFVIPRYFPSGFALKGFSFSLLKVFSVVIPMFYLPYMFFILIAFLIIIFYFNFTSFFSYSIFIFKLNSLQIH